MLKDKTTSRDALCLVLKKINRLNRVCECHPQIHHKSSKIVPSPGFKTAPSDIPSLKDPHFDDAQP
jgi:hypothetical protein